MKKAAAHAKEILPAEPESLVSQYLAGKERPLKDDVVAKRKSRFSTPALPTSEQQRTVTKPCYCKGKCATRKCNCRAMEVLCDDKCNCKEEKCKNRE